MPAGSERGPALPPPPKKKASKAVQKQECLGPQQEAAGSSFEEEGQTGDVPAILPVAQQMLQQNLAKRIQSASPEVRQQLENNPELLGLMTSPHLLQDVMQGRLKPFTVVSPHAGQLDSIYGSAEVKRPSSAPAAQPSQPAAGPMTDLISRLQRLPVPPQAFAAGGSTYQHSQSQPAGFTSYTARTPPGCNPGQPAVPAQYPPFQYAPAGWAPQPLQGHPGPLVPGYAGSPPTHPPAPWHLHHGPSAPQLHHPGQAAQSSMPGPQAIHPGATPALQHDISSPPAAWTVAQDDSCIGLYARAYCGRGDALFAPAFFTAAVALCLCPGLPPWALLFLIPALCYVAAHIILMKGYGLTVGKLQSSQLPASLVGSLEILVLSTFVFGLLPVLWQAHWLACAVMLVVGGACPLLHWRAMTLDPGHVTPAAAQVAASEKYSMGACRVCQVMRPLRAKHCVTCNRCIERFDHHCPVIWNCLGAGNLRTFYVFIVLMMVAQSLHIFLTTKYCIRATRYQPGLPKSSWGLLQASFHLHPGKVLLAVTLVPTLLGNAFLVCRSSWCVTANLTTSELINWHRYSYLQHTDRSYWNPFDQGPFKNWAQFISDSHPVWSQRLAEEQQARQQGDTLVPHFSANSVMRHIGTLQRGISSLLQTFQRFRSSRQLAQENYVLQQYGGVSSLDHHGHASAMPCAACNAVEGTM